MKKTRILVVEDDELAAQIIEDYLIECGFDIFVVFTATNSISYLKTEHFDILLLDINLPDFTGYEVLKSIKNHISIPIIITSAYSDTKSKLTAFKYGASDYMVKPLDLEELEARIWLQLGRYSEIKIEKNTRVFSSDNTTIYFRNEPLHLTTIEFEILSILLAHANQPTKREELLSSLSSLSSPRSLDNHIKNIRKKLQDDKSNSIYLKTEYGVGYILHNPLV